MITFDIDEIMAACESYDYLGFCTACGAEHDGVEPDAQGYTCEDCGEQAVEGAENILIQIA
jgi:predicted RNA-binding Zn-ribbon protein involved in translation (DUF1610 family)|tara:strand:+ start:343 stop:525 length:183 start_codon:yes stop_codon:yes gene_type:complete